jgi:pimeloyl-ACP methyl ester carboxylesterase
VVLLHGGCGANGTVRTLVEHLSLSHRVITIDSAPLRETGWVERVLRVGLLPGERFHLIGCSQGVEPALHIARARPHRLHSLTLCEAVGATDGPCAGDPGRTSAPTRSRSDGAEQASAIARVIRGIDALDLQPGARIAMYG